EELQGHGQGVRSAKAARVSQELRDQAGLKSTVMRALDPGIHHLETRWVAEAKPGHDEVATVSPGDGSCRGVRRWCRCCCSACSSPCGTSPSPAAAPPQRWTRNTPSSSERPRAKANQRCPAP